MFEFVPYKEELLPHVLEIFSSNQPKYFFEYEREILIKQLEKRVFHYYLMLFDKMYVGAGGFALNENNTVSLCWGMVHADHHGKHFGLALLQFRLQELEKTWPDKMVVNITSQHTTGFFEKYGFVITSVEANGFGPGLDACKMELKK